MKVHQSSLDPSRFILTLTNPELSELKEKAKIIGKTSDEALKILIEVIGFVRLNGETNGHEPNHKSHPGSS